MHTLLIVLVILIAAVAGYFYWENQSGQPAEYSQEAVNAELDAAMPADPSDEFKDVDADIGTL